MLDELPQSNPIELIRNEMGLNVDGDGFVHVYTDGVCSENSNVELQDGQAGYGIWWAKDQILNRSERADRQTKHAAEIQAVTETIKIAKNHDMKAILIHTHSNFLVDCATKWMKNWIRNDWKNARNEPIKNREELEALDKASQMAPPLEIKYKVHYKNVKGNNGQLNNGIAGNEEADQLAVMGARKQN